MKKNRIWNWTFTKYQTKKVPDPAAINLSNSRFKHATTLRVPKCTYAGGREDGAILWRRFTHWFGFRSPLHVRVVEHCRSAQMLSVGKMVDSVFRDTERLFFSQLQQVEAKSSSKSSSKFTNWAVNDAILTPNATSMIIWGWIMTS